MKDIEVIKKLVSLLKDYKSSIIQMFCCLLIQTLLTLSIPLISKKIMDDGFIGGNHDLLIQLVLITFVLYIIRTFIDLFKEKKRIDISAKIQYKLSKDSFKHLINIKYSYFNDKNYAEILNNLSSDINNMTSIADESVFFVITQVFSMIGGIIGLFILDVKMTILVLLFIPIKCVIMKYFAKRQKNLIDKFIHDNETYAAWFGDTVGGIKEIKLNNLYEYKLSEFNDRQNSVIHRQKKMNMLRQWNGAIDTLLVQILITLIYIVGSNFVFSMQLSVGSVFAFITYTSYVTGPISAILNIGYLLAGIIPSAVRYYGFMDLEEEKDHFTGLPCSQYGDIEMQNLSFSYNGETEVLNKINLCIHYGEKIALVGKNGSGKSTLIDLLLQIYEPTKGKVLFTNKDISELDLYEYRNLFSVVNQDIYMFNDTIRNNICLYNKINDSRLLEICTACGLKEFIKEVSMDYEVGQDGVKLSGGQKQKIALARAIVKNSPFIILDEATSSSDACSEKQINALLHSILSEHTVIVITHKTDILEEVDKVFEIENGKIL